MLKILIITDSLGLPRKHGEYESTWPVIIKQQFSDYEYITLNIGGMTSSELVSQLSYYDKFEPILVIIQDGIVDCAPRAVKQNETLRKLFLKSITKLNKSFGDKLFSFLIKYRCASYVSIDLFKKNIEKVKSQFSCPVLWIEIVSATHLEDLLPGVLGKIANYNNALDNMYNANFIKLPTINDSCFIADGHHLSTKGHKEVANNLCIKILSVLNKTTQRD